ncbi:MAG: tetratricopeptide repeat protein [Deltaproteobacteria bacterium]
MGHSHDPGLDTLLAEAAEALAAPLPARVVGEPVKVVAVERQGNDRRGLVAQVRRRSRTHAVSLADLEVEPDSPLANVVDGYRAWLGLEPAARGGGTDAIEPGAPIELVVLAVKESAASCRTLDGGEPITLRTTGIWKLVPGEIATVRAKKRWRHAGTVYLSGKVESSRLDVVRLGLKPLGLEPRDAEGPRPAFEMKQIIPGADPASDETDPIVEAGALYEVGDPVGARTLLMRELREDLRCVDAHAHLGNHVLEYRAADALRHYEAGLRIGELSLGPGFDGVLPWKWMDNRPFLRCLHGHGLALWKLGRMEEAEATFRRMLRLNPSDQQGARVLLDAVEDRMTYEAFAAAEEEAERGRSDSW